MEAVAERADVVGVMLHLIDDAVVGRVGHLDRALPVELGESREGGLALFPGLDDAIEARVAHSSILMLPGAAGAASAFQYMKPIPSPVPAGVRQQGM